LTLSNALNCSNCAFTVGYLDDVILGDTVVTLGEDIQRFQLDMSKIGVTLNTSKCEILGFSQESRAKWHSTGLKFHEPLQSDVRALGSPIYACGFQSSMDHYCTVLIKMNARLKFMSAHEAFFLYRNYLSIPKLLHLLRTTV